MKLNIFNIEDFIKANKCPEVTNPIFFNFDTTPTADGLFSYDLFGISDEERKNTFGYIRLNGNFIHPLIYIMLMGRSGSIKDVLTGRRYAIIADKKIKYVKEDYPGAETGIQFIYDHFDEIEWINEIEEVEMDSIDKKTRLKFLKNLSRDEFFIKYWLVLPPFYRAESSTNRSMGDVINKLYKELILKTRSLKSGFSYELFGDETKMRIQNLLKDIYLSTLAPVSGKHLMIEKGKTEGELKGSGKNSAIRKHLLGKTIDWTASCVITSPQNNNANKINDKPVLFGETAVPLASLISMFQPFFMSYAVEALEEYLTIFANDFANNIKKINTSQYSTEQVEKLIKKFIKSPTTRFDPIEFSYIDLNGKTQTQAVGIYEFKNKADADTNRNYVLRPMTLADLFYIVAKDALKDKHVYVTRYPIANFQNIFPARVKVLSTAKSREVYFKLGLDDIVQYDNNYPTIPYKGYNGSKLDCKFYDVMICGNAYLDSLGGDYDGDMLYMKPVFSKEANAEAEQLIWKKTNMLNTAGGVSRGLSKIGKDCVITLYEFTKEVK